MKRFALTLIVAAFAYAASAQEKAPPKPVSKKATSSKAKPAAKKPVAATIPATAKEVAPGTFRWVDAKGQAWIYQKTPFGIMKGPEPKNAGDPEPTPTDWKVTESDDSVTFERPYPFGGVNRWTRKKSELTEIEQAVVERARRLQSQPPRSDTAQSTTAAGSSK